jgi:diacylglycerol kinase (ATP)
VACGSGFDAKVMAAADEGAKQSVGRAAYFAAAASLVPGLTAHRHRIAVDAGSVSWSLARATDDGVPAIGSGVFVVACGSGFDAKVMAAADEGAKRNVGRAAYFAAAASLVPGLTAHQHRIEIDGDVHEVLALAVLVVNAGELIPGLVAPRLPITANDGLLDVLVVKASGVVGGIVGGLELLARTQEGWSTTGASLRLRGRHVSVSSEPSDVIEVDGDVLGRGSFVADVLPGALLVVHPRARGGDR